MTDRIVLEGPDARLEISPDAGARMSSLVVDGQELLVTRGAGPLDWGCYPFAPFAGRIRDGSFRFDGRSVRLATNDPPHALHGTVFDRPWMVDAPDSLSVDLGPGWPFRGRLRQDFELTAGRLDASLRLEATDRMPVVLGWHPWFRRRLAGTDAHPEPSSEAVELDFSATRMYERGPDGLPTGRLVDPTPPPWDDCFIGLGRPPRLTWPGRLTIELSSSADHWVVYDEPVDALCLEPQTGPPDAMNLGAAPVAEAGAALAVSMTWRWWSAGSAARRSD